MYIAFGYASPICHKDCFEMIAGDEINFPISNFAVRAVRKCEMMNIVVGNGLQFSDTSAYFIVKATL